MRAFIRLYPIKTSLSSTDQMKIRFKAWSRWYQGSEQPSRAVIRSMTPIHLIWTWFNCLRLVNYIRSSQVFDSPCLTSSGLATNGKATTGRMITFEIHSVHTLVCHSGFIIGLIIAECCLKYFIIVSRSKVRIMYRATKLTTSSLQRHLLQKSIDILVD